MKGITAEDVILTSKENTGWQNEKDRILWRREEPVIASNSLR